MGKEVHKRPAPKNQIKTLKAQVAQLNEQLRATNYSLMNMRQMYEGAITEKNALKAEVFRANQIITALAIQARGKTLKIKEATFGKLAEFVGFSPEADDEGNLIITPISVEDVQEDIEEEDDDAS